MMHEYTRKDIQACLKDQRIVYIGDSTVRQLFWATAKKLNATAADEDTREAAKHEDLTFDDGNVAVNFIWDPFLNSSSLRRELLSYLDDDLQDDTAIGGGAGLITVGGGLWYARHFESDWLDQYKDSFDYLAPLLSIRRGSPSELYVPPSGEGRKPGHHVYVTPVQVPLYDVLSPSRAAAMTPVKINLMNEYLYNASISKGVKVAWSHSLMTWESQYAYEESGLHVIESVSSRRVDVLLNMRCNAKLTLSHGYPYDKTCCSAYETKNAFRKRLLLVCLFGALIIVGIWTQNRTQLLSKSQKHFSPYEFLVMCFSMLVLGILSIRRSVAKMVPGRHALVKEQAVDQPFLPRDQTDEWKGWMQFAILIYHYTGASNVLWVYQLIRILVASYLFLTGFGHTVFFYQKQDYSLKRSASVLIRLNLLSCLLPYVMETDYLFYYFAPLVSFWYLVIYLTMRIYQSRNTSTDFFVGKTIVSAVMVTLLIRIPGLFEKIFLLLQHTCHISWNVKEWRFRLQLDGYIVYIGMLAAIFYMRASDVLHTPRLPSHNHISLIQHHWSNIRILAVSLSLAILPGFWAITRVFTDKFKYNGWVPYISPLPIIAFVILRNSNRYLRNFYSSIFAWLGRCSLETFTLQFHIWLAADTKGLLSLGASGRKEMHVGGRHWDLAVLTIIFLWLSWLTADATTTITSWIIDPKGQHYIGSAETAALPTKRHELECVSDKAEHQAIRADILPDFGKRMYRWWVGRLEIRLCSILLVMWILNFT
ncbi:MAG: hypothetical protein Q9184_002020 [Pyrenodesmia sp. 2 TL-2023]